MDVYGVCDIVIVYYMCLYIETVIAVCDDFPNQSDQADTLPKVGCILQIFVGFICFGVPSPLLCGTN